MNVLDIFGQDPVKYAIQVWQYKETNSVSMPGGLLCSSMEDVLEKAYKWTGMSPNDFTDATGDLHTWASKAYKEKLDLVVIYKSRTGLVVCTATLPSGWEMPGSGVHSPT